jgi:hypothetical protein
MPTTLYSYILVDYSSFYSHSGFIDAMPTLQLIIHTCYCKLFTVNSYKSKATREEGRKWPVESAMMERSKRMMTLRQRCSLLVTMVMMFLLTPRRHALTIPSTRFVVRDVFTATTTTARIALLPAGHETHRCSLRVRGSVWKTQVDGSCSRRRPRTPSSRRRCTRLLGQRRPVAGADPASGDGVVVRSTTTSTSRARLATGPLSSSPTRSIVFSVLMALSGAILGPFLDSCHSAFGVLQYDAPLTATLWGNGAHPALITAWWVPELFGLAGVLIGWLYIYLDGYYSMPNENPVHPWTVPSAPSTPKILTGISLFTFQYWLSGALAGLGVDRTTILTIMAIAALWGFWLLDQTFVGFLVSAATALGGPLIEMGLLTLSRNDVFFHGTGYHYIDPGETGFFPLWIVPLYFLGGPANGNLARGYWTALTAALNLNVGIPVTETKRRVSPECKECNDTRAVACSNCDGNGVYTAMGGRSVKCSTCRGRGFVICRECFSIYGEDPNDIESIRELMSRMPD